MRTILISRGHVMIMGYGLVNINICIVVSRIMMCMTRSVVSRNSAKKNE